MPSYGMDVDLVVINFEILVPKVSREQISEGWAHTIQLKQNAWHRPKMPFPRKAFTPMCDRFWNRMVRTL
jgi:hypothetical protein